MKTKLNMRLGWFTPSLRWIRCNICVGAIGVSVCVSARGQGVATEAGGTPALQVPSAPSLEVVEVVPSAVAVDDGAMTAEGELPMKAPVDFTEILRVQIYLDRLWFSPGRLDGVAGPATELAVRNFNEAHGIDGLIWDKIVTDASSHVPNATKRHVVEKEHWKFITTDLPTLPAAQAKTKYMGYRTMLEMVMERFHCTEPVLEKLNPGVKVAQLKTGFVITVPNVTPFLIEKMESNFLFEEDAVLSLRKVVVDTKARMANVYDNGRLVAAFPIVPGQEKFIHRGKWKMVNMITTPTFAYDKSFLTTGRRSKHTFQLPPGPNNPVGMVWAGTSKSGIGLHGTSSPEIMNYARSSGCIRLANWDIARLHEIVRPGCEVEIR